MKVYIYIYIYIYIYGGRKYIYIYMRIINPIIVYPDTKKGVTVLKH